MENHINFMDHVTDQKTNLVEYFHPDLLSTQANASDNPSWEESMNGPDKASHWKASKTEIETLDKKSIGKLLKGNIG